MIFILWEEVIFRCRFKSICDQNKRIEIDILKDFEHGYEGILKLKKIKNGVTLPISIISIYLENKKTSAKEIMHKRIKFQTKENYALFFLFEIKLKSI